MANIKYKVIPEFKTENARRDGEDILEKIAHASDLIKELHKVMYELDCAVCTGLELVLEKIPPEGKSDGKDD